MAEENENKKKPLTLTPEEALVLKLVEIDGKSQEEVAEILGVSQATVSRILSSARKKLAEAVTFNLPVEREKVYAEDIQNATIAFATQKGGLDDFISPVFAASPTFTIVRGEKVEVVSNPFLSSPGPLGQRVVEFLISKGVEIIVAGNFGPGIMRAFIHYGITPIQIYGKKVREVLEEIRRGKLFPSINPVLLPRWVGFGRGFGRGIGRGWRWRRRGWWWL